MNITANKEPTKIAIVSWPKISNAFLAKISPYFKFPDWVKNKGTATSEKFHKFLPKEKERIVQKDINSATREDLISVYEIFI